MEEQNFEVVISDRTRQMLGQHIQFLAGVSISGARQIQKDILAAIRSLEVMPQRCPFLSAEYTPPNKYHKLFVKPYFLILYQIQDKRVFVDYIVDCRSDYQWLL